jgi:hypothetical protein
VTISQGASGTSNGTVQFAVAVNAGGERTSTLTIAGSTFTITQRAAVIVVTPTLSAPTAVSPIGGQTVDTLRPTLVVNNAASTGAIGTVTYRFEISDLDTFPADSRTLTQDNIAQGSGTTSWPVPRDLPGGAPFFWRARATNGTITSPFSAVETFRTFNVCSYAVSPTTIAAGGSASTSTVTVTAGAGCGWTAVSNAAFIAVTSGGSGTGNGTVTVSIDANTGAARSGTLTIAGQTVTVNQSSGGTTGSIVASFQLFQPAVSTSPTTVCQFRNATAIPSTCELRSTSFTLGTSAIVQWDWTVQYTYDTTKTITQSGPNPILSFSDVCGGMASTDEGLLQPLNVTLTVTDSTGATATAVAGAGSQPALSVRLFKCGF